MQITSAEVEVSGFTITNSGNNYIDPFTGGDAGIKLSPLQDGDKIG